ERALLDLVALGTVADVAPLTSCNRSLVRDGVAALRRTARPGLRALVARAGLKPASLTVEDISFRLAPRLNAAGRLASPELALRLVMTNDEREASQLAEELERLNTKRKALAETVTGEALAAVVALPDWERRPLLVLKSAVWEPGVLGAVASRLVEQLGRPVVLLHGDEMLHGSARSVPGFDLAAALVDQDALLTRHGGHSLAAGLGIERHNLAAFEAGMLAAVARLDLDLPMFRTIDLAADLPADRLTLDTARLLDALEPCGQGNETPVFRLRAARVLRYTAMGADRRHLRITIQAGRGKVEAIGWGAADRSRELVLERSIDLAGTLQINRWNGQERLQLIAEDFRPARG
ncbi:MAG: single-stranded-DNA-specific exonuclease RecJ, partial [Chloroflexia bacterium]|nr:single-stranded-DNA-specific exonuclease RecJ [Chloroflexia bacterium]